MKCLGLLNIQERWNASPYLPLSCFPYFPWNQGKALPCCTPLPAQKQGVISKVQLNTDCFSSWGVWWSMKAHVGPVLVTVQLDSTYLFLNIAFTQMLSIIEHDASLIQPRSEYSSTTKERGKPQYLISCRHHLMPNKRGSILFAFCSWLRQAACHQHGGSILPWMPGSNCFAAHRPSRTKSLRIAQSQVLEKAQPVYKLQGC